VKSAQASFIVGPLLLACSDWLVSKCPFRRQVGDRGCVIAKVGEDGPLIAVQPGAGAILWLEAAQGERRACRADPAEGGVRIGGEHVTLCQLVLLQRIAQRAHRCAWNAAVQPHLPWPLAYVAPNLDVSAIFHARAAEDEWLLCDSDALVARDGLTFAQLLARVDGVEGIGRIRYTSPHPKDMREDVIRAHAELEALCEHIHLPLQSGSSAVLKRMRRTYTRERYLDRVALIREHVPDCAITTDIIVGFPGETEEDFEQTLEVAEEVGYDGAFTFNYSPRRGTEGATFEDQVAHEVKSQRMKRLVEVVQRRAHQRAERFVGRTLEVLVEGPSRTDPSRLRGRSRHNKVVNFDGIASPGELVDVHIAGATSQTLTGELPFVAHVR